MVLLTRITMDSRFILSQVITRIMLIKRVILYL